MPYLPPEIIGRIAAYADAQTRRAMLKSNVVTLEDVLYHLPPESLSHKEIKEMASLPLPNKYDSYLREVASLLKAFTLPSFHAQSSFSKWSDKAHASFSKCKDKVYVAMAYYMLTDGTGGLKLSRIKSLKIKTANSPGGRGITIDKSRSRKSVALLESWGSILVYFLLSGSMDRGDEGVSLIMYDETGTLIVLCRNGHIGHLQYRENGTLRSEKYWKDGLLLPARIDI